MKTAYHLVMSVHSYFQNTSKFSSAMSHSFESNLSESTRRVPDIYMSISEQITHLAETLEIENADGLDGNEMEIIALIRNCPFLYDTTFPGYNDAKKKDQAFKAIAKVFNVSSVELQQFWYTLKQSFLKFSKKDVDLNGTTCPSYFDEMEFLKDVNIKSRRGSCNTAIQQNKEESNTSASSEQDTPGTSNNINDLKLDALIDRIRANPILYDRKHKEAKHHELKLRAWKKISKEIAIPVSECVNRWKILREKYGRERKYRKAHPDGRKWYLFEKLSFLEDHVFKKRYSHTQMPGINAKLTFNLNNDIMNTLGDTLYTSSRSFVDENHLHGIEPRGPKTNGKEFNMSNMNIGKLSTSRYFEEHNRTMDNIYATSVTEDSSRDEDELFGLTIAAELRKITDRRKKIKLKADIYELLHESSNEQY